MVCTKPQDTYFLLSSTIYYCLLLRLFFCLDILNYMQLKVHTQSEKLEWWIIFFRLYWTSCDCFKIKKKSPTNPTNFTYYNEARCFDSNSLLFCSEYIIPFITILKVLRVITLSHLVILCTEFQHCKNMFYGKTRKTSNFGHAAGLQKRVELPNTRHSNLQPS